MKFNKLFNLYEKKLEEQYNKINWEQFYSQYIDIKKIIPKEERKEEVESNGTN